MIFWLGDTNQRNPKKPLNGRNLFKPENLNCKNQKSETRFRTQKRENKRNERVNLLCIYIKEGLNAREDTLSKRGFLLLDIYIYINIRKITMTTHASWKSEKICAPIVVHRMFVLLVIVQPCNTVMHFNTHYVQWFLCV